MLVLVLVLCWSWSWAGAGAGAGGWWVVGGGQGHQLQLAPGNDLGLGVVFFWGWVGNPHGPIEL